MTDTRTPQQRRRIMAAVRQRDTGPELALRRALHRAGARGWRCNYRGAPGRPDVAWPAMEVAVFVDGAFWHGHPSRHRPGRSGAYWDVKIARNVERDRSNDESLLARGWAVLRIWDFDVQQDSEAAADRVLGLLCSRSRDIDTTPAWLGRISERRQGGDQGTPRLSSAAVRQ